MSSLPPPRLPGQPPDRPPIRRPDDHLPRPGEFAFNQAPPPIEAPRRRTGLLVAAIACVVVFGAAATVVVGRGGDESLDTEAAAERLDDDIRESDGDGELDDCPVDEFRDVLAGALEPVGNDELFDTIDLGEETFEINDSGDDAAATILCDVEVPSEVPSDSGERIVSLALSPEGDQFVEGVGDIDGIELEEVGEFRGGTFTLVTYDADADFVTFIWADEHLGVGLAVAVSDVSDIDEDALLTGFEEAIPGIVEQLAGD